jgi:uncharacterized membrane-anchored protein
MRGALEMNQNWLLLAIAVVLLINAIYGLITKKASMTAAPFNRADHPIFYWSAIVVSSVLGIGCLAAFIIRVLS